MAVAEAELADWRRQVSELYVAVRAQDDPERAHALWRSGRNALFRAHPQSPLPPGDPLREAGVPYWAYDPALRFELPLLPAPGPEQLLAHAGRNEGTTLRLVGHIELPAPLGVTIGVWWLQQYAGGLFLPLRDGTAGETSYAGGRYILDTAKGADLGGTASTLVVDLNFLYHPSCRYASQWHCPLAPPANIIAAPVQAGERLSHSHLPSGARARRSVPGNGGKAVLASAGSPSPAGRAGMVRADGDAGHADGENHHVPPGAARRADRHGAGSAKSHYPGAGCPRHDAQPGRAYRGREC